MDGISGFSSNDMYGAIASGKRINSAADDASGLAISEKLEKENGGLTQGAQNASAGNDAIKIADGATGQITESLQRIYELSVKASNTLMYGAEERGYMQSEISSLLKGIDDISKSTNYNGKNLLDGSTNDMKIATNPDGSGMNVSMPSSTVKSLGLEGYDVSSGKFDINRVKDALKQVSGSRAKLGAQSVVLEYAKNYNDLASENTLSAKSRIEDLDIGKAVGEKQKKELLNNYMLMMQKKKQEEEEQKAHNLFGI